MKRCLLLSLLLFPLAELQAQQLSSDSLSKSTAIAARWDLAPRSRAELLRNPALQSERFDSSLSTFATSYLHERAPWALQQAEGRGGEQLRFATETYQRLAQGAVVWGEASYQMGRTLAVRWRSSMDAAMLQPYQLVDSLGGDLRGEEYRFLGGWGRSFSAWSMGLSFGYRAASEWRSSDPRPRHTVTDFEAKAALGRRLRGYALALELAGGRYLQTGDVTNYAPNRAVPEWHATGLASHYVRFAGRYSSASYEAMHWATKLELQSLQQQGLSLVLGLEGRRLERRLEERNQVPLNHYSALSPSLSLGWRGQLLGGFALVQLLGQVERLQGYEHIVGSSQADNFPILAQLPLYAQQHSHYRLRADWEQQRGSGWGLRLGLGLTLEDYEAKLLYPEEQERYQRLNSILQLGYDYRAQRYALRGVLELGLVQSLSQSLSLPLGRIEPHWTQQLQQAHQARGLQHSRLGYQQELRYELQPRLGLLARLGYQLELAPQATERFGRHYHRQSITTSIGLYF